MTAPEDPFRSPTPGAPPPGPAPAGDEPARQQPFGGQPYRHQPYAQQQDGRQPYAGPAFGEPRPQPRNGLGVAALVLGVLALLTGLFVVGGLLGIAAVVLGAMGRARARRGEATNGRTAIAGLVLGVLGLLLSALAVAGAVTLFGSDQFSDLTECLESAGGDRAAQQQCQADFEDQVVGG